VGSIKISILFENIVFNILKLIKPIQIIKDLQQKDRRNHILSIHWYEYYIYIYLPIVFVCIYNICPQ